MGHWFGRYNFARNWDEYATCKKWIYKQIGIPCKYCNQAIPISRWLEYYKYFEFYDDGIVRLAVANDPRPDYAGGLGRSYLKFCSDDCQSEYRYEQWAKNLLTQNTKLKVKDLPIQLIKLKSAHIKLKYLCQKLQT